MGVDRMGRALLGLVGLSLSTTGQAQEAAPRFGLALSSSANSEVNAFRLAPTGSVLVGKSQLEAGVGLHPFIRTDKRVWSGELGCKFFPNGLENTLNPYLLARFAYVNDARRTYFRTTYHHLFLSAGYGLTLEGRGGTYMGTNVSAGPTTHVRRSDNPYPGFASSGLFDGVGFHVAAQLDVGYRF